VGKKKKKKPLVIHLSIELPEEEQPQPSSVDTFVDTFLRTLSYWFFGFFVIALVGIIF